MEKNLQFKPSNVSEFLQENQWQIVKKAQAITGTAV